MLTPYVLIDQTGVTIVTPRAEMGQGTHTTLAALVAEELDLDWDQVRVMHGPAAQAYYNGALLRDGVPFAPTDHGWLAETARDATDVPARFLGLQVTGGSTSTPDAFDKMRAAGAVARLALVRAAAARLGVAEADLKTGAGAVIAPDGSRIDYRDLAAEAAAVELPEVPLLRPRESWRLLGRALPRTDMVAKATGTARFAIDVRLPGMVFASIRRNPAPGAAMVSFDPAAALALPGVQQVLPVDNGYAVVAASTWAALQGLDAVTVDWAAPETPVDDALIAADLAAALGDAPEALAPLASAQDLTLDYSVPHLAHATMEPMGAAAWLAEGKLQVWAGTQFPTMAQRVAAEAAGVAPEAVEIHTEFMGGGFGRRSEADFVRQAATLAKALSPTPVLLTWSREEDTAQDMYRPAAAARIRARVEGGVVTAFRMATAAGSIIQSMSRRIGMPAVGSDSTILQGASDQPYQFPDYAVTGHAAETRLPLGFWRSVGASQNGFFHDCAMDELAHLAGDDPLTFRMRHLADGPSITVLETVAAMSGWGSNAPGRAKGVGFCHSFGVPVAQVIEVEDSPQGLRLNGAWIAADVGIALDPESSRRSCRAP